MNYITFRQQMKPYPVFSIQEIEKFFPGFDRRRLIEWQQKGYLQKLRNRYYCFTNRKNEAAFLCYTANNLYHPSYISLESSLARYGIIPEEVFQTISCTTLKTQAFDTHRGRFVYRHIKSDLFFGYRLEAWENYHYAIAEPEKAVIDYFYLHPEVQDVKDVESLRWNRDAVKRQISFGKLQTYEVHIGSAALSNRLLILREYLNVNT